MAHIKVIDETEATGRLKSLYENAAEGGLVDNILKIHSLHPASLAAHLAVYRNIMHGPGPLPRIEREMVAVVVSKTNRCDY